MREIAVFRHNLFRISEPFITQQAQQLRRHKPLYLGRLRYGAPPAGAASLALEDLGPGWPLPRIAWQMLTRNPGPYQRLLGDRRPSLIHAHFGIEGVYALPLAQRLKVPLVTTFHGFDATLSTAALLASPAWANYPLFRHRLARSGDLFLCASSFVRERVLAMGFPAARTHVHYIGVDCEAIRPRAPDEETPTILHVARLVEVKGAQYLVRALAALPARHANARLVIIGDGPLRRSLETLAGALGVGERVRFLGALPHAQVLAWMRRAAMLALPSVRTRTGRVEGLGMVLLEAAATGVPAVGSRIGGIPEGIVDGETGFLAPERDAAALAGRMADLLDDRALRLGMGAAARAHVERRFDIRRQTETLEDLYDVVLSSRG
ncbi:glucosyltransferase [Aliidongia dinghuensis]|uniref:Glucosyltransferase n=1 Tax=Aliidongia dinghuensis TaxID=1867774 RepID=A0A8J3E6R7_9PROT|nr:glycosyltransferase [Aliidongia dinghuensis]GGF47325.1 glucosyltransferase [Aliidongia dinghuensis]